MSTTIPDALKPADISRFAARATQVEKAKPAIAYWCYYWIVQQIVTKGLHNTSQDAMQYTVQLMDKLETAKATNDDAIKDEVAAQALIEQFGLDVFSRADNAVRANKASRQTADTFQAAYTFLELLQIWPPLDQEIAAKIKFAKYHALRIAKAIKAGEDPNLSNPAQEPEPESNGAITLDPNDPEVKAIQGDYPKVQSPTTTTSDAKDDSQSHLPPISPYDSTRPPVGQQSVTKPAESPSTYNHAENYYQTSKDVSPIGPPSQTGPPSVGGGYFPRVSDETHRSPDLGTTTLPSAPADLPDSPLNMSPVHPTVPPAHDPPAPAAGLGVPQAPSNMHAIHFPPHAAPAAYGQPQTYLPAPASAPPEVIDDQAMIEAQKHARWAISALNFEDVPTGIKELRAALESLGARGPW